MKIEKSNYNTYTINVDEVILQLYIFIMSKGIFYSENYIMNVSSYAPHQYYSVFGIESC